MPPDGEPRIAGAYRVAVGPSDVGRRVSLRRALPEGGVGDVVGELVSWDRGEVVVRTRRGDLVTVAQTSLLAGKVVPS